MQMSQIKGLSENQHYEALVPILVGVKTELSWWINQLELSDGKSIISSNPSMILTSDASDSGLENTCESQSSGGYWSPIQQIYHINGKELLSAFLHFNHSLKITTKNSNFDNNRQCNSSSSFQQNGRNQKLLIHLAKQIWDWCQRNPISSRVYTSNSECHSKMGIKKPTRFRGLDVRQNNFQSDYEITGVVQN